MPQPPASATASEQVLLPPHWRCEVRTPPSGICYKVYVGPNGERAKSRVQAWQVAEQSRVEPDVGGSGRSPLANPSEDGGDDDAGLVLTGKYGAEGQI